MIENVLPDGWSSKRLKYVATYNDEVLPENTAEEQEIDYVEISGVSLARGIEEIQRIPFGQAPSRARRKVRSGDTLVSTVRTYLRAIANVDQASPDLIGSTGFCVIRPSDKVDSSYIGWVAKSEPFVSEVVARSVGVSYPAINASELVTIEVPVPPLKTQQRIARFLDEKTARIDGLIEKKRGLLDRLTEKRQALITRTVTKGLNSDAQMKPSGIDWLGDIPAHWEAANLRWLTHQIKTGPFGAQLSSAEFVDDEIPVINPSDILDGKISANRHNTVTAETAERLVAYRMKPNDIVFARRGEMGRCALVRKEQDGWLCGTGCIVVTPDFNILNSRFTEFFLGSQFSQEWFSLNSVGATMANLNEEILGLFPITVPPVYEQISIGEYLDRSLKYEDDRTTKVQQSVRLLEDYRAALVTAAVTGKISELL